MRQLAFWQQISIISGVVVLDQVSKWLVSVWRPEQIQLNQYLAFSQDFLGLGPDFWLCSTGILLFVLLLMTLRLSQLATLSMALLLGGGLSNWLDRWWFGGVRDWLVIPATALKNNLADYVLVAAVVLWIWQNRSPSATSQKTR